MALRAVVQTRPGVHDVEMRATAWTSQHRIATRGSSVQRRAGQRSIAGRAVVTVGVQLVADPQASTTTPSTEKPPTSPAARSARSGTGCQVELPLLGCALE